MYIYTYLLLQNITSMQNNNSWLLEGNPHLPANQNDEFSKAIV